MLYDFKSFYKRVVYNHLDYLKGKDLDKVASFMNKDRIRKWKFLGVYWWNETDKSLRHRLYMEIYNVQGK